jgi:hypothetical protein
MTPEKTHCRVHPIQMDFQCPFEQDLPHFGRDCLFFGGLLEEKLGMLYRLLENSWLS